MRLLLEGSALHREDPRDWDLRLYLPDTTFQLEYGMTAEQFLKEGRSGKWSSDRWHWADDCVKIGKLLANISGKNLDFRILPESLTGTGA